MGDLADTVLTFQWALSSPSARGTHKGLGFLGKGLCPERGGFEGARGSEWAGQGQARRWVQCGKDSLNGGGDKCKHTGVFMGC